MPGLQADSSAADAGTTAATIAAAAASSSASAARTLGLKDQGVWPVADTARVFLATVVKYLTQRGDEMGNAVFDKVGCFWHAPHKGQPSGHRVSARHMFGDLQQHRAARLDHQQPAYGMSGPPSCVSEASVIAASLLCPSVPLCLQDDDLAVDFVTAASNLRSACYGIPQQSAFDVKVRGITKVWRLPG